MKRCFRKNVFDFLKEPRNLKDETSKFSYKSIMDWKIQMIVELYVTLLEHKEILLVDYVDSNHCEFLLGFYGNKYGNAIHVVEIESEFDGIEEPDIIRIQDKKNIAQTCEYIWYKYLADAVQINSIKRTIRDI
jgi:hypothetical protein